MSDLSNMPVVRSILSAAEEKIYNAIGTDVRLTVSYEYEVSCDLAQDTLQRFCRAWAREPQQLKSESRKEVIVIERQIVMLRLRQMGYKVVDIGQLFNRDHTTAIKSINAANKHLQCNDLKFMQVYNRVKHLFNETASKV